MTERTVVDGIVSAGLVFELSDDRRRATVRMLTSASEPILTFGPVTKRTAARFAVGHPGECSSIFRVWANKGKLDVYSAIRTWKDLAKFSFHQSGRYIFHLSSVDHPGAEWASRPDPGNRRISAWDRPEPFVPGWTHLMSFMVPTEDVRPCPTAGWEDPQKVRWIKKPERSDTVTEFRVAIGEAGAPLIDAGLADYLLDDGIVDGFVLANGRLVLITMHVTRLDDTGRSLLSNLREGCMERARNDGFDLNPELGPRFADHNVQSDGRHALWDIAPL
ncbi:hypothetical protein GII32_10720 [Gordonia amarae]|uniref:hypothetical protein n=1 Tax=Gordonia amarae TaxID=36821 RepID=UPI001AF3120D|nr:hypothetical protein [Gordonia amarae]QHN30790.1 hypothetical protein GII32_10720 [Gordonia amarae]